MSTIGIPSRAMAAASSSDAPTVIPCSSAVCPAFWITGPSASGSENGMPISNAAIPDVASFFPTSSDRFLLGCPAIMYPTSFSSPLARSAPSSPDVSVFIDGVHVLVAAAGQAHQDAPAGTELACDHSRLVQRVRRLERRHDAFEPRAELECGDRVFVADCDIVDALEIAEEGVLGSNARVVQTGGHRVRRQHLPVAVLQQVRERTVQHAWAPADERGRVLAGLDPRPGRLHADQRHVLVVEEGGEDADGVRTPTDARDHDVGQLAVDGQVLLAGLVADDTLQVADHFRVWVRTDHRTDDVVGRAYVRHPVPYGFRGRVLERLRSASHLFDLSAQQLHAADVHRLAAHVLGAHVNRAREAEASGDGGDGDAVLARTGLGDDALLAHLDGEQRLSDRVVELVGAGMAEVLALEMDVRPAEMLAQPVRRVKRRRPSDEGMAVTGELELKLGVRFGFMPYVLQLLERAHQRLGHVLAAIRTEPPADRVLDHPRTSASRTAWTNARTLSGSLTLTDDSTPLDTSTPYGLKRLTTLPTLPGSRPPAMNTFRVASRSRARSQSHVRPVPPRWSMDQESSMIGSGHASALGTWSSRIFSTFKTGRPASKPGASEPCSCTKSRPTNSAISRTSPASWSMNTPTMDGRTVRLSTMAFASSGVIRRSDEQKWKPRRSAPASTAAWAATASQIPQILTWITRLRLTRSRTRPGRQPASASRRRGSRRRRPLA